MEFTVAVQVDADPIRVWELFVDVERWPELTASMSSVRRIDSGDLRVGSTAMVKQPGLPPALWRVTELEPGRVFTWESRSTGVSSIGRHVVEAAGTGARVTLTFRQTGPLAGLAGWLFRGRIHRSVRQEADGFRRRAEADSG